MKYYKTPHVLHKALGEQQSLLEILSIAFFTLSGSCLIFYLSEFRFDSWKVILGFILIADVLAGCIANFSLGTNSFYAQRPKSRIVFIAIHFHILLIAWLLSQPLGGVLIVWLYTIISAFIVNALKGKVIQRFIAANLMCYGLFIMIYLEFPMWFLMVSVFFMIKVLFSFSVDHYESFPKQ